LESIHQWGTYHTHREEEEEEEEDTLSLAFVDGDIAFDALKCILTSLWIKSEASWTSLF